MEVKKIILFLLFSTALSGAETCFFIPPKGWEIGNPEKLSPRVHIAFLGKSSSGLPPSVNLATEPVKISLEAYVEAVRKKHAADPNSRWRDLGTLKTSMGMGKLTEIESPTKVGKARIVQLIVVKDEIAYILTGAALKEEFSKYYKTFDQAFKSLQMTPNLIESYPSATKQLVLKELVENLTAESWDTFEKKVINDFTEMGPYWQILLLQDARSKIGENK